jgi:hypothetical protein
MSDIVVVLKRARRFFLETPSTVLKTHATLQQVTS